MGYEYRELSKRKIEQLNALKLSGLYGREISFDGGWECLTTPEENVVFTQTDISHESDMPDRYFLEYNGWYYFIDMFSHFLRLERNGKPVAVDKLVKEKHKKRRATASDCFMRYEIQIISAGFTREPERAEGKPAEEEIVEVLKEIVPAWDEYAAGLKYPKERYFITLCYKGEELLHEYCLREEQ